MTLIIISQWPHFFLFALTNQISRHWHCSPHAVITMNHRLGGLNNNKKLSWSSEDSGDQKPTVMVLAQLVLTRGRERRSCSKPSSLAYRWLFSSSHSVLPVCSSASKFPLIVRTPVMLSEDHLMISLQFGDLYKDLTSQQGTGSSDFNL